MRFITLWGVLACCFVQAGATPFSTIIPSDSIINLYEQNADNGTEVFESQLKTLQENDDLVAYLQCIKDFAIYFRRQDDFAQNIKLLQRGLLGEPWRAPRDSTEWSRTAWYYTQLGYTYSEKVGDFRKASEVYQEAADIFKKIEEQSVTVYRFVQWPLANIYTRLGDYAATEPILKQLIDKLLAEEDYGRAGLAYNDLGILYKHWDKGELALEAFQNGLAIPNLSNITLAILILNISDILINQDRLEEAEDQLLEGEKLMLQEWQQQEPNPRAARSLAGIYQRLASLQAKLGVYDKAFEFFDLELSFLKEYYGDTKRREFGKHYIDRATIRVEQQRFEAAIIDYQAALKTVLFDYEAKGITSLPNANLFYAENTIEQALVGMADAFFQWSESTSNIKHLTQSLDCYKLCYKAEEVVRQNYMYDHSKLFNLEGSRNRSEQAIQVAYQLFEQSGKKEYLYQAFTFAERNRSSLLREAFRVSKATELAGISTAEQTQENELKQAVSDAEELIFRLRNQNAADSIQRSAEESLLVARDSLRDWIEDLERKHPKYYQLKYASEVPSLESLQSMLGSREQLLEFFVGNEKIYVFKIDRSGLTLRELPLPTDLDNRVLQWRRSIENYQQVGQDRAALLQAYHKEAYLLYQDLLAPVLSPLEDIDQLLIISSGILDLVPFEALLSRPLAPNTPLNEYPYLLTQYDVSYSYSASLQWSLHQLPVAGQRAAGFAPQFDGSNSWPELSCSAALLQRVIKSSTGDIFSGQDANIDQFRANAHKYRLLHLATHAQANPEQGDFSFIVFSDGQGGYDSLYAKDLYLYNLEAELVILSACETALGTLYNSEGVISLARAFHYAGARSVLYTSWRINEGANCSLLEEFYRELEGGASKKEALRAAKLKYLATADPRAAHPVYWAGFQLLGNPRPLEPGTPWHRYALAAAVFLLIGGAYWRYRTHRRTVKI